MALKIWKAFVFLTRGLFLLMFVGLLALIALWFTVTTGR
jgi:hypothetical protein